MRVEINETSLLSSRRGPGPVQVLKCLAGSYSGLSGRWRAARTWSTDAVLLCCCWPGGGWARGRKGTMASQLQVGIADTCSFGTIFLVLAEMRDIQILDIGLCRHEAGRPDAGCRLGRVICCVLQAMFRIGLSLICIACILLSLVFVGFLSDYFLVSRFCFCEETNGSMRDITCAIHTRSSVEAELELQVNRGTESSRATPRCSIL
jgi:hypothetical protein